MRKHLKVIVGATVIMAGLLAAPLLYAHEGSGGMPTMGTSSGNMRGMMNMMGQMSQMAQNCNTMMTSMMTNDGAVPNEQWKQERPPATPDHADQSE